MADATLCHASNAIRAGISRFSEFRSLLKSGFRDAMDHNSFQPKTFKKQKHARKLHLIAPQKTHPRSATIREG
jgi:hypothetical protein